MIENSIYYNTIVFVIILDFFLWVFLPYHSMKWKEKISLFASELYQEPEILNYILLISE